MQAIRLPGPGYISVHNARATAPWLYVFFSVTHSFFYSLVGGAAQAYHKRDVKKVKEVEGEGVI